MLTSARSWPGHLCPGRLVAASCRTLVPLPCSPGVPRQGTWRPAGRTRKGPAHLLAGNSKATGRTCLGPAAYCQSADIGGSDPKVDGLPTLLPRTGTTEHDGEKGNKT